MRSLTLLTNLFPLWVLLAGILALFYPPLFTWFHGPLIVWGLAVIMLGMGVTLGVQDFKSVAKMPKAVAVGFVGQYTIMPFLGWSIAHALKLPEQFAAGLILVACCPGGTASNVVTFLAKGNVALSVLMTMCSTFAAIVMTPLLTKWLAGTFVPVDAVGLLWSTVQVVLLPLIIGIALHHYAPKLVDFMLPVAPLVSVITIALICASIIGQSAGAIRESACCSRSFFCTQEDLVWAMGSRSCSVTKKSSVAPSQLKSACKTRAWVRSWQSSTSQFSQRPLAPFRACSTR